MTNYNETVVSYATETIADGKIFLGNENAYWLADALNPTSDLNTVTNDWKTWGTVSTEAPEGPIVNGSTILSLIMMIITCFLIIVGNTTVLIVFHYTPALDNATGVFIKSLAVADLGVGVCCSFSIHSWFAQKWPYGRASCAMVGYILAVAVGVSIIGLACLSLDRFIAIRKPLKYRTIMTKGRARFIAIAVWMVSAGMFMPSLFGWGTFHYNDHSYECSLHWEQNVAFSFFIISVLVMPALATSTFCYCYILKASFDHTQQIERSGMMFKVPSNREGGRNSYEKLLAKIFLVIISAFYVTWLPFVITKTLRGLIHMNIPPGIMFFFSWLGVLNSFLNCVVYSIGHRSFRVGFFVVVRKIRRSVLSMFFRASYSWQKRHRRTSLRRSGQVRRQSSSNERFIDIRPTPIPVRETSL